MATTRYIDGWKVLGLALFALSVAVLQFYPYSVNWSIFPSLFCWFLMIIVLLAGVFSKHGSVIWRGKGHG